jgi:hypothetical protein
VESGRSCQYINNMDTAGKWVCRPGQRARLRLAGRRLRSRAIEHHEMHRLEQRGTARWISLGAPGRIRTCDLGIRSPLLYPLSYGRSPEARVPPVGDSCRIRPRDLQKRGGSAESARNWGATRARRISRSRSLMCSPCARASPTCTAGLCVTGRPGVDRRRHQLAWPERAAITQREHRESGLGSGRAAYRVVGAMGVVEIGAASP